MKLSSETQSLLKSFAGINSNLLIREGDRLATRNATGSVQARATVSEAFPRTIPIYDLNSLLGLLSVAGDAEIDFHDKYLVINSANGGQIQYHYAEESLIKAVSEDEPAVEEIFQFELSSSEMSNLQKTASIVAATNFTIGTDGAKVTMLVNNPSNPDSNNYSRPVGIISNGEVFTYRCTIDNIRSIVGDDYTVTVGVVVTKANTKVPVFRFASAKRKLSYLIAVEQTKK